jgi:hypothetical protein
MNHMNQTMVSIARNVLRLHHRHVNKEAVWQCCHNFPRVHIL